MSLPPTITGKAYVLGDNVDTDQIIPAQYLTFNPAVPEEYRQFGKYALSGVPPSQSGLPKGHVPFHGDDPFVSPYRIIVAGKNFGCGSSREHAPIAIKAAGVSCVIASSFARIFFRNSINLGLPILECPEAVEHAEKGDALKVDLAAGTIFNETTGQTYRAKPFPEAVMRIIQAGGLMASIKDEVMAREAEYARAGG